ncbi:MAG: alanine--tRNA ligase [Candidatus ainarchaeum sp.]|nr:alanine--tRNA ligase [Candidatus ainarchaeum sp.]
MLSKDSLRSTFSGKPAEYYEVQTFRDEGFERSRCPKCGKFFWSAGGAETCGDSSCEPYSFFGERERADYVQTWKKFEKFFADNGHASVPRYPVICRWRDDLYFTIASIVDFMRLEQGQVVFEYPENPLVVPQMCLRFNDIPNVGVTGRHNSCFMMAGQHAFNYPKAGYWKDRCIELNYGFMTKAMGIPKKELRYVEDVWAMPDLSSFGPCIETYANGLEIVNSVFMQYRKTGGDSFSELDVKVIDVGWGFERVVWHLSGTPTAYDAVFGPVVPDLVRRSGIRHDAGLFLKYAKLSGSLDMDLHQDLSKVKRGIADQLQVSVQELDEKLYPLQAIYAVADHARTLSFALADGGLPSNLGGGYNLRVVLRRALGFIEEFGLPFSLPEVVGMHARYLAPLFPELEECLPGMQEVLEEEEARYRLTLGKSRRTVVELVRKSPEIRLDELKLLYESKGITPELVQRIASEEGVDVRIPSDFYASLTETHVFHEPEGKPLFDPGGLGKTIELYYNNPYQYESEARVVSVQGNAVVLDKTLFYPEGGGQSFDTGSLFAEGKERKVLEVQKVGRVIFHVLDDASGIKPNANARMAVDAKRRRALMRHHTATHIIVACARKLLGKQVWQAGARKDEDKAHIDLTFHRKISDSELHGIERLANQTVLEDHKVRIKPLERGDAEQRYGFTLYQGGGAPGRVVRVVEIMGDKEYLDAEACAGLHVSSTGEVGLIKIMREERIQDGVSRLVFTAGDNAVEFVQAQEKLLRDSASILRVSPQQLPEATARFFEEWKERGKRVGELEDEIASVYARDVLASASVSGVTKRLLGIDAGLLQKVAVKLMAAKNVAVMLANREGDVVVVVSPEMKGRFSAVKVLNDALAEFGGSGGGSETFARGKTRKEVSF